MGFYITTPRVVHGKPSREVLVEVCPPHSAMQRLGRPGKIITGGGG